MKQIMLEKPKENILYLEDIKEYLLDSSRVNLFALEPLAPYTIYIWKKDYTYDEFEYSFRTLYSHELYSHEISYQGDNDLELLEFVLKKGLNLYLCESIEESDELIYDTLKKRYEG